MHYYLVRIGVQRHWKREEYTYASEQTIAPCTIVRVPFGKKKKIGYVVSVVKNPSFETKEISDIYTACVSDASLRFMDWFSSYYLLASTEVAGIFFPAYLQKIIESQEQLPDVNPGLPLEVLTPEQDLAVQSITSTTSAVVLHGVTASGKTRIYLELVRKQLEHKRNVLILYPEISITPQLAFEIEKIAPVVVFHSQLTDAERSRIWSLVLANTQPMVILGARSALFLPFQNLGAVIVDEAHDSAYKQDNHPRYHSLYVAGGLARSHNAQLVFGSATPPITETELILGAGGKLVCLHEKAIKQQYSINKCIVDMRDKQSFNHHPLLSDTLIDSIRQALLTGKQSLLFINRRGTSRIVLCENQSCDWLATCRFCELPLTYHHDRHILLCHTCGTREKLQSQCPKCQSNIRLTSLGSKAIVQEIKKLFPAARIERYDSDTEKDESFYATYESVRNGSVDILVGTQQIIKGLDLPKLAVVGILHADLSLRFPDYSSEERTFQLVTQAIGRVGRGHTTGTIVVQTYIPQSPLLQEALREDWHGFRERELHTRKQHHLPPFIHTAKVLFREKSDDLAMRKAQAYIDTLSSNARGLKTEGPVDSFHSRIGVHYYVQVHLKSPVRSHLIRACSFASKEALFDLDPITLL
jgi:primosomal protein N' (replication factor Y)